VIRPAERRPSLRPRGALILVLAVAGLLSACQSASSDADTPQPRVMTSNNYSLEDHRACLAAGHESGTPDYQECRKAWIRARATDLGASRPPSLGFF